MIKSAARKAWDWLRTRCDLRIRATRDAHHRERMTQRLQSYGYGNGFSGNLTAVWLFMGSPEDFSALLPDRSHYISTGDISTGAPPRGDLNVIQSGYRYAECLR